MGSYIGLSTYAQNIGPTQINMHTPHTWAALLSLLPYGCHAAKTIHAYGSAK